MCSHYSIRKKIASRWFTKIVITFFHRKYFAKCEKWISFGASSKRMGGFMSNFPIVLLCILCAPLLETQQNIIYDKSYDDSCKPFFFAWHDFFADTVLAHVSFKN